MPITLFGRKDASADTDAAPVTKAGPTMTTATVRDLLFVTYAVPPNRVASLVPPGLTLDRLPTAEGELSAFVQVVCGLYLGARWSPLPEFVGDSFYQVLYRVLIRRNTPASDAKKDEKKTESRAGAWVLRTLASTTERHISRRLVDRAADFARIRLFVDGNPARNQYHHYQLRAEADDGPTHLSATFPETPIETAPFPFGSLSDMTAFLTQRPEQFFRLSVPGSSVGLQPLQHDPVTGTIGTLTAARVTPLVEQKILTNDEAQNPQSVLLVPSLALHAYPPRPVRLTEG